MHDRARRSLIRDSASSISATATPDPRAAVDECGASSPVGFLPAVVPEAGEVVDLRGVGGVG